MVQASQMAEHKTVVSPVLWHFDDLSFTNKVPKSPH